MISNRSSSPSTYGEENSSCRDGTISENKMSVPRKTTKIYRVVLSAATFFVLCLCTRHQFNLFQCLPKEMIADNAPQVKYQVDKLLEEIRRIKNETSSEIETQKNRGNKLEEQLKKIIEESSAKISIGENRTNNLEQHTRKYQIDPRYFSDPRRFRGEMTKKLSALLEKNIKSYSQLRDEGNLSSYVQDDHPLFNGVKLGDFSIEALLRMYPKVDVSTCLKYNADKTGQGGSSIRRTSRRQTTEMGDKIRHACSQDV
ncbi:unnamed protein product [Pseudo-nitzschia multistriata]|uniref:Uncharacterized protein n=1 Tax=Pseudo-nitzschia multistriata TaxID=183589 RepID=A0A448Z674_9STRA|nr:unnamed protein product [Pseudo-nitzschia multistriata]